MSRWDKGLPQGVQFMELLCAGGHVGSRKGLICAGEPSRSLSRNGVSGAAGKPLVMKGYRDGGRTHWDAFRGFLPGLGQRQEGKKPTGD